MSGGHVFISHGSENRDEANAISAFIEGHGVKTWIAPRDVRPGVDYSEELQAAIEACTAFVILVTDVSNKSPYVRAETEMAFSTNKPIFPIRKSDLKPAAGLALFLKIRHWTDAFGNNEKAAMDRLALELRTVCGVTTPAPVPPPPPAPAPVPPPEVTTPVTATPVTTPPAAYSAPPAPAPTTPPVTIAAAPATHAQNEERLRTAIGPNADFYIDRWAKMDAKNSKFSWNWPACLANVWWFAYRKMWVPMVVMIVVYIATTLLGALLPATPAMVKVNIVLLILPSFAVGYWANHLYRQHVDKLLEDTAPLDQPNALATLRRGGGISMTALAISMGVAVIILIVAFLLVAAAVRQQVQRQQQLQQQQQQQQQTQPQQPQQPQQQQEPTGGDKPVATVDPPSDQQPQQ